MKHNFFLILVLFLCFFSCQTNEESIQDTSNIKTVSINDALSYLNNKTIANRNTSAKSNKTGIYITNISDEIRHEPLTDTNVLLTVIPATTVRSKLYSRILLLEVNGAIESVVFGMMPDKSPDTEAYDGDVLITDMEGNFIKAYTYQNGFIKSEYVLPENGKAKKVGATSKLACDNECPFSDCALCDLATIIISGSDPDIPMINYFVIPPILGGGNSSGVNGWNVGSAGISFSGDFGDFMNGLNIGEQDFLIANFEIRNGIQLFLKDNNFSNESINIAKALIDIFRENTGLSFEEALLKANIVIVDAGQPKIDPEKELECFDLNQGAKLIVYVQQPRENSDAIVGPNEVGHAFIGIEQGEIVRQVGFYPDSEVGLTGVGDDYNSAIKTNYDYLYHVSISQDISKDQLTSIVNYIIDFPATYNTNDYACTDFAIAVGNKGGMKLPSTTVGSLLFEGRSPGQLGQEIRAMESTPTRTITTKKGKSPNRKGDCSS
ncbi:hypothetical protein [Hyunsoonleella pacifica]|uniref:Uncharacterized protein n=1 Tax=Hyunsoonleella pacifica TaxID=1080224 RepID=A0A4Q9FRU7_9FLAO|nr:hypothetical protein [Hyunsoonleella pacifica]TBN16437.1 hypothetical protein EYD46_07275 [Hyunsoonleella pacifica]GGD19426.1 hypothetical protein GCM10011368_21700 [Hyunsoonleella pacifica]